MHRKVRPTVLVCLALSTAACDGQLNTAADTGNDAARTAPIDAYAPPGVDAALDAYAPDAFGEDAFSEDAFAPGADAPGSDAPGSDAPIGTTDAPTRRLTFTGTEAIFSNPERGLYRAVNLMEETTLDWLREEHPQDSVVYSYIRLDDFRDRAISDAFLTRIRSALDVARRANYSLVLRLAYNEGPYPDSEPDAPLARIQAHLTQVTPILRPADDVISVVQAGLIGAWGEWHTSTNDLARNPAARRAVAEAVLAAIPPNRATQIRYPAYIGDLVGEPLNEARAWTGTFESRIGFHNDCFLASATDTGTYPDSGAGFTRWHTFIASHSSYVPVGGETCAVYPARSACTPAMAEMAAHHYSFINRDYHPDVVDAWERGGCLDDIERRLGYRFVMTEADLPEQIRPGGSFQFRAVLRNDGWAAPFNARPLVVRLRSGSAVHEVTLTSADVRHFMGGETSTITAHLRLPASLATGTYTVAIGLPSGAAAARANPAYAIRFANAAGWNATLGENNVGNILVSASAPGTADPSATALAVIP